MSMDVFGQLLRGLAGGGTGGRPTGRPRRVVGDARRLRHAGDGPDPTVGNAGGGLRADRRQYPGGGLQDLIRGFQKQGMGDAVSSWIGTGDNMPITPDQVQQGLGHERTQQMAQRSGLSLEALLPMLAAALPMVIDALTPKGQVPDRDSLQQNLRLAARPRRLAWRPSSSRARCCGVAASPWIRGRGDHRARGAAAGALRARPRLGPRLARGRGGPPRRALQGTDEGRAVAVARPGPEVPGGPQASQGRPRSPAEPAGAGLRVLRWARRPTR